MPYWSPSAKDLGELVNRATKGISDEQSADNHLWHALFDKQTGLYRDTNEARAEWVNGTRLIKRLRRRAWIERYFRIRDESGAIRTIRLNAAQRRLEHAILRMERANVPVRIIILKARQEGISTYIQSLMFERGLRTKNFRGLIVAHNADTAKLLLQMAEVARTEMLKTEGADAVKWQFKMRSKARAQLEWAEPMTAQIQITSAEAPNPGIGGTRSMLHLSEFAKYPDPEIKQTSILPSLPTIPGTYGFKESTAEGAHGLFHDEFWEGWRERRVPLHERTFPWASLFMAWWEHDSYRYSKTYGSGRMPSGALFEQIRDARDQEEDWLLKQSYFRRWSPNDEWEQVRVTEDWRLFPKEDGSISWRKYNVDPPRMKWRRVGVGMRKVDIDQLAWRRMKIREAQGDLTLFNREYPSRPEVAFVSSGRPVFNLETIDKKLAACAEYRPHFQGDLRSSAFTMTPTGTIRRGQAPGTA